MNKTYLLALAASLMAAPLAFAHDPAGTLKNYCEDPSEWGVHDYGPPATGLAIFLGQDGNIAGDCNGDTVPADFDGHVEFAFGGGWLLSVNGDGVTSGSLVCYGAEGHHGEFGTFTVTDVVLGNTVPFRVEADTTSALPPTDPNDPDCGDFQTDEGTLCVGSCQVTFPAGVDGAYIVYVGQADGGAVGTQGHIETATSGGGGLPPAAPTGHITIHRTPNPVPHYVLIRTPGPEWTCQDLNAGGPATTGGSLQGPNPRVQCTPPGGASGSVCNSVTAGGEHAGLGAGNVTVTSSCATGPSVAVKMTLPALVPVGGPTSANAPTGPFPWTCSVDDSEASPDSDYWVYCNVNP